YGPGGVVLRTIPSQRVAQLIGINRDIFDTSMPAQLHDGGNAPPSGHRGCVDQLLFGINNVGAGALKFAEPIQNEWPYERYRGAGYSGGRHAPFLRLDPLTAMKLAKPEPCRFIAVSSPRRCAKPRDAVRVFSDNARKRQMRRWKPS